MQYQSILCNESLQFGEVPCLDILDHALEQSQEMDGCFSIVSLKVTNLWCGISGHLHLVLPGKDGFTSVTLSFQVNQTLEVPTNKEGRICSELTARKRMYI